MAEGSNLMAEGSSSKPRGKSWTKEEDRALCTAYLGISQDGNVGNNQPNGDFWVRIWEDFVKIMKGSQIRTKVGVCARWGTIRKKCGKYHAHLTQVQNTYTSGDVGADKVERTKQLYAEVEEENFNFEHCWKILDGFIKWPDVTISRKGPTIQTPSSSNPNSPFDSQTSDTAISLDSDQDPTGSVSSPRKRPIGRKAEKRKSQKAKANLFGVDRLCNLMVDFNSQDSNNTSLDARRVQALEELAQSQKVLAQSQQVLAQSQQVDQEHRIMQMNLDGMDEKSRLYWDRKRDEILAKQQAEQDVYRPIPPSP